MIRRFKPRRFSPLQSALRVLCLTGALALIACTFEEEIAVGPPAVSGNASPNESSGEGQPGSSDATPSPTPSPSPGNVRPPSPTPAPTATPRVAVTGMTVTPTHVVLHPAPQAPMAGLSLISQAQLSATVTRSDGALGGVLWHAPSGGVLSLSPAGLVNVPASTPPGIYRVRAVSLDDPNVSREVVVEVLSDGELGVILE